jgi:hypothetical protein
VKRKAAVFENYICATCGTQFAATDGPPGACPICQDERQYIGAAGQQWTTLAEMQQNYHNVIRPVELDLTGVATHPDFCIAQRALLVQTPQGNLLWDCISLVDDPTVAALEALGGIDAIAISHPHYYASMVEWAHAFDATIYLHAGDRQWVMRPDAAIQFWEGETLPLFGRGDKAPLTLINTGGHYTGSTVAHWPAGAEGRGVLLTGDTIHVVSDRRYVTFMYSYPNMIPLPASSVRRIVAAVEPFAYDRIYGAWWPKMVPRNAREAVRRSAERYIGAITDPQTEAAV